MKTERKEEKVAKIINLDEDPENLNWLHQHRLDKEKKAKMKHDEKYYEFLDGLRESGQTNMFGATSFLLNQFRELDEPLAKKILVDWMESFHLRHPKKQEKNCD